MRGSRLSEKAVAGIRELHADDPKLYSVKELASIYECSECSIRNALDPARYELLLTKKREHRRADPLRGEKQYRDCRHAAAAKRAAGITMVSGPSVADARARQKLIPADTRNFTQRFCGDPLPGRSALDQRSRHRT